jgi:hypothetical protein
VFLHLPPDGLPHIVDAAPTDARISDLIGGIPVKTHLRYNLAVFIREDARDLPLNVGASFLCTALTEFHYAVPMLGPIVLAGLNTVAVVNLGGAYVRGSGKAVGLETRDVRMMAGIAEDGIHADAHRDYLIHPNPDATREQIGEGARRMIESIRGSVDLLPPSYPYPAGTSEMGIYPRPGS